MNKYWLLGIIFFVYGLVFFVFFLEIVILAINGRISFLICSMVMVNG